MAERWILQFCHCHYGPFLDVARQYSALFKDSQYKVLTVYLTGEESAAARAGSSSDEVIFLDFKSRDVRGLKIGAIRALKKIIAGRDIALIIAHRFKPIYIACLASTLPVIGVHHAFGDYDRAPRRWFAEIFRKRLALLAVSDAVRDDIRKRLPRWAPDRIETLHNRLDVEAVRREIVAREQARQILNIPQEALVIANVGRLHPDKDQATLIAAFARALPCLPPTTLLVIAGSGPLAAELRKLAEQLELDDRIHFLGQIPQARRLFSAFDLFVLTSDHEPFGMVLLEAMAADVPVMATDCGGAPEVVGRQNLLFDLGNSGQLAGLLVSFFVDTDDSDRQEVSSFGALRLDQAFSDIVARRRFFSLPMMQAALSAQSRC
ncbi:MAG: glycosyltransferase [Proteobacteria bacterium]|nr:glycosyltransferase [Pseudomonadota bacterium]